MLLFPSNEVELIAEEGDAMVISPPEKVNIGIFAFPSAVEAGAAFTLEEKDVDASTVAGALGNLKVLDVGAVVAEGAAALQLNAEKAGFVVAPSSAAFISFAKDDAAAVVVGAVASVVPTVDPLAFASFPYLSRTCFKCFM